MSTTASPAYRRREPPNLKPTAAAPGRFLLHGRAPATLRRHMSRSLARIAVLATADAAALLLARAGFAWTIAGPLSPFSGLVSTHRLAGIEFLSAYWVGLLAAGSYGQGDSRRDLRRLLWGVMLGAGLTLWGGLWGTAAATALASFALLVPALWVALAVERLAIDGAISWFRLSHHQAERVVFVGDREQCKQAEESLLGRLHLVSVGWVAVEDGAESWAGVHAFCDLLESRKVDTVVLGSQLKSEAFESVVRASAAAGCRILSVSRCDGLWGLRPTMVRYRGLGFVELTAPSLKARHLLVKRTIDVLGAVLGLAILSLLLALVALAIKLDSRGPVFFRQERVGRGGRLFRVWKFRTMRDGVRDDVHRAFVQTQLNGERSTAGKVIGSDGVPVFKLVHDDRVTRVGRLLRRTSIDELPQLINVLRGEMSLVGPRPPLPYEVEAYETWQFDRLGVRPGITGLWQVSGRNLLTYREMCQLDVSYVERWSVWLDLKILLKTIPVVVLNSGRAA